MFVYPLRAFAAALALSTILLPGAARGGNGDPVHGFPNYRERAILALTNACRQGPQQYRDAFLGTSRILRPGKYPAVAPLYWTLPLNKSARAHSIDMAMTPCFQHASCDGTDLWDRIRGFYSGARSLGENIATGYDSPLEVVNGLLLDGGAADFSHGDGHRKNIMSARFREMGSGFSAGGPYGSYDTQDFGDGAPHFVTPLVSGSHILARAGKITFLASYNAPNAGAPKEASLELEGAALPMALAFGTPKNGTYRASLPGSSRCRSYRFRFRDGAGRTWWYPESGKLLTTGEGGCSREYEAVAAGNRASR
jgi:hypothetical protein